MVRFNIVVPWFKAHKMFFPTELKNTFLMEEVLSELKLVSVGGFKSKHDDCLDCISMLGSLQTWRPSHEAKMLQKKHDVWEMEEEELDEDSLNSYLV
jgi:hypothetical protein